MTYHRSCCCDQVTCGTCSTQTCASSYLFTMPFLDFGAPNTIQPPSDNVRYKLFDMSCVIPRDLNFGVCYWGVATDTPGTIGVLEFGVQPGPPIDPCTLPVGDLPTTWDPFTNFLTRTRIACNEDTGQFEAWLSGILTIEGQDLDLGGGFRYLKDVGTQCPVGSYSLDPDQPSGLVICAPSNVFVS